MTLPTRDENRVGWVLGDGTFLSDEELRDLGIPRPYLMTAESLWEKVLEGIRANGAINGDDIETGGKLLQMVPRDGPGREAASEELRRQKLEILTALARSNVVAILESDPKGVEAGDFTVLAGDLGIQATVFIKISEDLPRIRLTQIFEWEE